MINDVLYYINECKEWINMKSGEKLDIKSKVLITKGPKERFVFEWFQ